MWSVQSVATLALLLLTGCSRQPGPISSSTDSLTVAAVDAGPRIKAELALSLHAHLPDGGIAPIEFQPNERPRIEPTQKLELSANLRLHNYRIRVLDEADRAMISDDVAEGSDGHLDYRISFHEPLKPGHRYTLVLDAQSGSSFSDSQGNSQSDQRLEFQVAGDKEKPPPKKSSAKKHRKH